jgi:Domain of unknown function (DUF222)/HNH endonuclease
VSRDGGKFSDADDTHARTVIDTLLPTAGRMTTTQIRQRLRHLLLTLDPDAIRKRHTRAIQERWVQHSEYANGTAMISGSYLPKDKAAAAYQYLDAIAVATKAAGDGRRLDQIRADVFVDLLAGVDPTLAGAVLPAPRKGVINLQIGLTTLACLDDRPADIAGFGPVLADIARQATTQLATVAQWRFTLRDDNGNPIAEGPLARKVTHHLAHTLTHPNPGNGPGGGKGSGLPEAENPGYRPTAAQKAFVHARDITCRAPGCSRPAYRCDLDHIRDRIDGGPTTIDNICTLCRRHHRAKHVAGYQLRRTYHGILWTSPRGHRYIVSSDLNPSMVEIMLEDYRHGRHGHGNHGPIHLRH